jgi:hypothetical protein
MKKAGGVRTKRVGDSAAPKGPTNTHLDLKDSIPLAR